MCSDSRFWCHNLLFCCTVVLYGAWYRSLLLSQRRWVVAYIGAAVAVRALVGTAAANCVMSSLVARWAVRFRFVAGCNEIASTMEGTTLCHCKTMALQEHSSRGRGRRNCATPSALCISYLYTRIGSNRGNPQSTIIPRALPQLCADFVSPVLQRDAMVGRETQACLLYTSPSPRDRTRSRMPSSA